MATIRKQWLLFSKDNAPSWWQPKQVVRIVPYKDDDRAFILQAVSEELGRRKGYSTITVKNQLYSAMFQDGDYKAIPHDNPDTIVIYPIRSDTGTNESDNVDEKEAELDIDLNKCTTTQMKIWTRLEAIKAIKKGRIPQSLVQTLQYAVEMTEQINQETDIKMLSDDQDSYKALKKMSQDKTISESVRSGILKELVKLEGRKKGERERKTIVMETKEKKNASNPR